MYLYKYHNPSFLVNRSMVAQCFDIFYKLGLSQMLITFAFVKRNVHIFKCVYNRNRIECLVRNNGSLIISFLYITLKKLSTNTVLPTIKRLYGSGFTRNYPLKCYCYTSYSFMQNERKGNQLMNPQIVIWWVTFLSN